MSEDNGQAGALITVPTGLGDDQLLAVAAAAEKRIEAVNKIKALALRVTNVRDWRNQGGNPYLQVSGAEKVARLFGISWRLDETVREDHADGHFSYTVKGYFSMGTAEIEVIGTRSSTDPLFALSHGAALPPSEIDRNDVKKSAVTNCIGNGITRLLGIRNLTWDDLKSAGLEPDKIGKTDYGSGDPNAAMKLPNYGRDHCKGKPVTDPAVTVEDLQYYLGGCEKDLANPEKKQYHAQKTKLKAAIEAELAGRATIHRHAASQTAHPPSTSTDTISETQWADWIEHMKEVPDRVRTMVRACPKFHVKSVGEVLEADRHAFILTCQDEMRREGIAFEAAGTE